MESNKGFETWHFVLNPGVVPFKTVLKKWSRIWLWEWCICAIGSKLPLGWETQPNSRGLYTHNKDSLLEVGWVYPQFRGSLDPSTIILSREKTESSCNKWRKQWAAKTLQQSRPKFSIPWRRWTCSKRVMDDPWPVQMPTKTIEWIDGQSHDVLDCREDTNHGVL